MKPANQNEMDVLLRSLARRDGGVLSGQLSAESHLDADELNAFAEGAVTERVRSRYSAHLAECANCRSLVVTLTQSAGLSAPRFVTEDKQAASFWQQLGAFFSQPVLRFVIPAVVLVSIIGIGVIALREDSPGEYIAQHDASQQVPNVDQVAKPVPSQPTTPTEPTPTAAPAVAPVIADSYSDARRGQSAGSVAGVDTSAGPSTLRKEDDTQPSKAMPTFAPEVTTSAPPPPSTAYEARDRAQTLAREEAPKREDEAARIAETQAESSDSTVVHNKAATSARRAAKQPTPGSAQGLTRDGRVNEDKDANKSTAGEHADSRTVAGKRFVRQNNAWVDSGYQSGATTNVKRGSEQYRALISDEPNLRTFSEQLGGEVIVVWKGRAYKFY
jgi:hypothetical protein